MKNNIYFGEPEFEHSQVLGAGVLLANLGTPDAPTTKALRRYLTQFLKDPRVIELPKLKWFPVLYGIVLRRRPKRSAALYREIWWNEGSPLLVISRRQVDGLKQRLTSEFGADIPVEIGMRYGNPSIGEALRNLKSQGVTKFLVLPLYPQYAGATTGSTFDAVAAELQNWRWVPEIRFINQYHDLPRYIDALAKSANKIWKSQGKPDYLVMSFHGIPQRYFDGGDPYYCHCQKTGRLLANALGLERDRYQVTFQSRFGKEEWIKPYTDITIENLARSGVKRLDVICPGFAADCLETLEEIEQENRKLFLDAGGEQFRYIPALNDDADFLDGLAKLAIEHMHGWNRDSVDATIQRATRRAEFCPS